MYVANLTLYYLIQEHNAIIYYSTYVGRFCPTVLSSVYI